MNIKYIFLVAMFVFNMANAQIKDSLINQVELMKHFIGSWKADYNKDTLAFWDAKLYGTGLECNYRFVYEGNIVKEGKQLWGYDTKIDKFVAASLPNGMDIEIDVYWFTSENRCEALSFNDIFNPEKATLKWVIEFKSPDIFIESVTEADKLIKTITYARIK